MISQPSNKLKFKSRDSDQFVFQKEIHNQIEVKRVQTGVGFGFTTEDNRSIQVKPSNILIRQGEHEQVFLYFKYPKRETAKAVLINSAIELFDTDEDYLVLFTSSTYKDLTL